MKCKEGCLQKVIREFQKMLLSETYAKPFRFQKESPLAEIGHSVCSLLMTHRQKMHSPSWSWSQRDGSLSQLPRPQSPTGKVHGQPSCAGALSVLPRSQLILPTQKPMPLHFLLFFVPLGAKLTSGLPEQEHSMCLTRGMPEPWIHTS